MASVRQTSFAAGELSPLLWGRTDLELYAHGAKLLRNFVITPQGAAVSRPGSTNLSEAKTVDVVLLPFVFSDDVSYVLELGERYLRVHDLDGFIGVELVTPYLAADLPTLQYAQSGSILTLTHTSYAPKEIHSPVFIGGFPTAWSIQNCRFGPPSDGATGASMTASFVKVDGAPTSVPHLVPEPRTRPLTELFTLDAAHPPREWKWKVAALVQNDRTGELAETLPRSVTQYSDGVTTSTTAAIPNDNLIVLWPDAPVRLSHPTFAAVIPKPQWWSVVGLVWYRGRGDLFGYIGTTRYAQAFIDVGDAPDYARQPLRGESPFTTDEHPAAVAFFQQRRLFAGSLNRPSSIWPSATDEWGNHDRSFPPYLTDAASFEASFVSRRRESIRSLITHRRLLTFTDSSVWSAGGGDGAVTAASFEMRVEDEVGATKLQPLVIDGAVLYVKAKGRGVRALSLAQSGSYQASDITWHAEHLFRGYSSEIVSWCFQRDPWGIIWAAQADGSLLSCTRTGESTWAWTKHELEGGVVRSVASVPGARTDVVVMAVTRGAKTFIERQLTRDRITEPPITEETGEGSFALDCTGSYVANLDAERVCTGLERFEGQEVWAVAPGNAPQGPLVVIGGAVTVGPFPTANRTAGNVLVLVGRSFVADVELLDAAGARLAQKTVTKVGFEVDSGQGLQGGVDFDHLSPWEQRDDADSYNFPSAASDLVLITVSGTWNRHGGAVLRQDQPLPVTVLGITRELEPGGT
ncbi:MAG: hypothetical protein Q8K32_09330 [Archangium sp.]|nr:hypothetical protein [Archangium sp.]